MVCCTFLSIIQNNSVSPSAINRKYQGTHREILNNRTWLEVQLTDRIKDLYARELRSAGAIDEYDHELRMKIKALEGIMFINLQRPPHSIIQSYYIILWANVDIHYAMN